MTAVAALLVNQVEFTVCPKSWGYTGRAGFPESSAPVAPIFKFE
jgi:hypothetical protein